MRPGVSKKPTCRLVWNSGFIGVPGSVMVEEQALWFTGVEVED